jgi:hypothetical protein
VDSREGDELPRYPIVTVPPACGAVAASGAVRRLRGCTVKCVTGYLQ